MDRYNHGPDQKEKPEHIFPLFLKKEGNIEIESFYFEYARLLQI